nr:hypothetical protein [Pyxidicoccus fallax]
MAACSGPEAPDAAVCRDVITRLCQTSFCPGVSEQIRPGLDCDATLLERTGCGAEDFTFSTPSRERFLSCREPLLNQGISTETPPACTDTLRFLAGCEDVTDFFQGVQP